MTDSRHRELERRARLYDQLATMHAILRDRCAGRAAWVDLTIVVLSVGLGGFTFADSTVLAVFGFDATSGRFALGVLSLCLFAASLVAWKVDWKAAADRHGHAVVTLADLKAQARSLLAAEPVDVLERERYLRSAETVVGTLAKVPEAKFLYLKRAHLRKVAISRLLDKHPGASVYWMKWLLFLRDTARVRNAVRSIPENQE